MCNNGHFCLHPTIPAHDPKKYFYSSVLWKIRNNCNALTDPLS